MILEKRKKILWIENHGQLLKKKPITSIMDIK